MHATPQWGEEGCSMLRGLMQDAPLLISGILEYAARAHGEREIVSILELEASSRRVLPPEIGSSAAIHD